MRLPILLLLAACTGTDKPADTDDTDVVDTDTDLPADDTGTPDPGAPTAPEIVITPAAPPAGVDFAVVLVTPSTDPDGDPVTYTYAWSEDGAVRTDLSGEGVPGAETADGEVWSVTVTPNDGAHDGPAATASVTIGNSPPSAFGVTFNPSAPVDDDTINLVLDPAPVDPDGDALTTTVTWYEDGSLNPIYQDELTVPGRYVDGGEVFRAVVSVTDGYHEALVAEGTVTVANNPPEIRSVRLEPTEPADDDDLVVTVGTDDPDGNDVDVTYQWFRNGVEATDVGNVDTVPASATGVEEEWYVLVTATDGTDTVSEASDVVTVIPWEGSIYTWSFTARIAPGGATGTGTWAYDMLSYGGRRGTNDCALEWDVDLTSNPRACPDCEYAFDAVYTYDTAASTITSGTLCSSYATDATGSVQYGARRSDFILSAHDRSYYMYESMYLSGSGSTRYSGPYSYSYGSYAVSSSTDTAGYETITAVEYNKMYYYY